MELNLKEVLKNNEIKARDQQEFDLLMNSYKKYGYKWSNNEPATSKPHFWDYHTEKTKVYINYKNEIRMGKDDGTAISIDQAIANHLIANDKSKAGFFENIPEKIMQLIVKDVCKYSAYLFTKNGYDFYHKKNTNHIVCVQGPEYNSIQSAIKIENGIESHLTGIEFLKEIYG